VELLLRKTRYQDQRLRISALTAESVRVTMERERHRSSSRRRPTREPAPMQEAAVMQPVTMQPTPMEPTTNDEDDGWNATSMRRGFSQEIIDPFAN
jgi:hypothetical protein